LGNYDPCSDAAKAGSLYGTAIGLASAAKGLWNAGKNLVKGAKGGLNLFKKGSEQALKPTGWKEGDRFLNLPNKGTPQLNWKQNYGALRNEMRAGKPIYDSYRLPNGELIPTSGFLNAERSVLQSRGWIYNANKGAWLTPKN
ncbi:MAG: hypothetical protein GXX85_04225, partial [Ignavibacteria bacterium]|nr:hypothetical protein [Ignavibacteria bacterium]